MHYLRKKAVTGLIIAAMLSSGRLHAQGVGIFTNTPDPSAALDINSTDKGLLIPRVSLTSLTDNSTVPNPAKALLVYNTNSALLYGAGLYYNTGLPISPIWKSVSDIKFPFSRSVLELGTVFELQNVAANPDAVTIHAHSSQGYALSTEGKIKIAGAGQSPGVGKVLTSDANGNATWQGGVAFSVAGVPPGGAEKIAGQSTVKVQFALEKYDLSGNYNDGDSSPASTFIAPTAGIYHFDIKVSFANTGSSQFSIGSIQLKNSSSGVILASAKTQTGELIISKDIFLLTGDNIEVNFFSGEKSGVYSIIATGLDGTYFNGRLVIKQ